jgi:hypothetical protein
MPAAVEKPAKAKRKDSSSKSVGILKIIKVLVGVALIPACIGLSVGSYELYISNAKILREQFWFFAGLLSYILIYSVFQNPIKTYVIGHELSHAVWTWLFRGKVMGLRAGASGGSVIVSKSNVFISLAPYFFPFYTALSIASYLVLRSFWPVEQFYEAYRFILGFTWSFHLLLTIYAIMKGQDDLKENGTFFSLIFIYCANVLCLGLLWVYLSDLVTLGQYFGLIWDRIDVQYGRLLP